MEKRILKLSVILPVYNEEKNIERCINSLINQRLPHKYYEIIISDDYSTDKTVKIAEKYIKKYKHYEEHPNFIKLTKNVVNLGIAKNRNHGALKASPDTEILVHVDADAFYPINFLETVLVNFLKRPNMVALSGVVLPHHNEGFIIDWAIMVTAIPLWDFIGGTGNSFCIKKDIFWEMDGFHDREGIQGREDMELWSRLEEKYPNRIWIDKYLVCHISLDRFRLKNADKLSDLAKGWWRGLFNWRGNYD